MIRPSLILAITGLDTYWFLLGERLPCRAQ